MAKAGFYASEVSVSPTTSNRSNASKRKSISKIYKPFKKQGWGDSWNFVCPKPKYTGKVYLSIGRRKKKKVKYKSSYAFGFRVLSLIIFLGMEDSLLAVGGKEKQIPLTNMLPRCSPDPNIFFPPLDLEK